MPALFPPDSSGAAPSPSAPTPPAVDVTAGPDLPALLVGRAQLGFDSLAWSVSRHRLLATCERAVFWHYFGSRGKGLVPGDPDAKRAWALRHLTDVPLLTGTVVHQAARRLLDAIVLGGAKPTFDSLLTGARFTLNQAWINSQPAHIDRFWRSPTLYTALREIAVRGELSDVEIVAGRERLRRCLMALMEAPVLADVANCNEGTVYLPPPAPMRFTVAGSGGITAITAWAAVDFAYRVADPQCVLERAAPSSSARDAAEPAACERGVWTTTLPLGARFPSRPTWCVADFKVTSRPDTRVRC